MALNVSAGLVPTGGGTWETHDGAYGKGGYRAVADNTARDAISTLRRSSGMLVYVIGTGFTYRMGPGLTNGDWVLQSSGTITAGNGLTGTTALAVLANGASIDVGASGIRRGALTGAISAAIGSNATAFASGDFGALDLLSSGFLRLGLAPGSGSGVASAASVGNIRAARGSPGFLLYARNNADTGDVPLISWDSTSNTYQLGKASATNQPTDILLDASGTVRMRAGTATYGVSIASTGIFSLDAPIVSFGSGQVNPSITQSDLATNGAAGQKLTIHAQNETGTTSTGGALDVAPGSGTTAGGLARLMSGSAAARVQWNDTGIGFYATAPIAKPTVTGSRGGNAALASLLTALANLGLLTDSSS